MSDRDDFESFVAARRDALLKSAYLLTGSHEDAEDLVQTALIKVVPKWSRIADHPEPYVRQVLARESINRWRRRRWREVTTTLLPDSPVTDDDGSEREVLRSALLTLSPRQRAVMVLRYYEDLTERETAHLLGLSLGTVKSYAKGGLERLRQVVLVGDEQVTGSS